MIKLKFKAATENTSIQLNISGGISPVVLVGTSWTNYSFTAHSSTITIFNALTGFDCGDNNGNITGVDLSHSTQLVTLYRNQLATDVLDAMYCSLPVRTDSTAGLIYPVYNTSPTYNDTVLATNAQNAIGKNRKVQYYSNDTDIPATTGTYDCSTAVAEAAAEQALTLYPNPVADVLYLSATARTIRIYDIYGIEVAHATDTDRIDVAHLPTGVYTVKADGTVAKMVKR